MTDTRRLPAGAKIAYGGSAVAFLAVLAGLASQVASGADPAIGAGPQATAAAQPPERVVVRRIIRRVVITEPAPVVDAPSAVLASAPSAGSAAPVPAAPAPAPVAVAPAPAPVAPAPAPVTRSS